MIRKIRGHSMEIIIDMEEIKAEDDLLPGLFLWKNLRNP